MELRQEAMRRGNPETSGLKLRWRALAVRHFLHVLPHEAVLELGAGSGLWTAYLCSALRTDTSITAAVFDGPLAESAERQTVPGAKFVRVSDLARDLPAQSFDCVVGGEILSHDRPDEALAALLGLLKPGGRILFFEARSFRARLHEAASGQGFEEIELVPFDLLPVGTPGWLVPKVQSLAFLMQHTPFMRELCATVCLCARKPGTRSAPSPPVSLAVHPALHGTTSVVVPCHNEEMNIRRLVSRLLELYGSYIHEIILVNDNSTDSTAQVAAEVCRQDPRVKLVNRVPPSGVGRALRDGYQAATGQYILSMDCDFVEILPEFRDLFDAIAAGRDGAIGSRFSFDSILMNYPFPKILGNRAFHLLVNLLLPLKVRDTSNNLKLYRAAILQRLEIVAPGFAANAETGLKPLLAGYDIVEVPVSWINRNREMGSSSFRVLGAAPGYFRVLAGIVFDYWRGKRGP